MATMPILFRSSTFTQVDILNSNVRRATSPTLEKETPLSTEVPLRPLVSDESGIDPSDAVVEFDKQRNILGASLSVTTRIPFQARLVF